jgi:ADP-ribose pyrophosphatase YjhB (NUDIX family)
VAATPAEEEAPLPASEQVRRVAVKLAALSQTGLSYPASDYDADRYQRVGEYAATLLAALSDRPADELFIELGTDSGHATPKVDVRGVVFNSAEQVLLMRERLDGLWSLPGGWADPVDSPSGAVVREIREETGYAAEAVKLIACWDRDRQGHRPSLPVSVYKLFFLCRASGDVRPPDALETLEIGWFALDALPPLSLGRVNARQLGRALAHHRDPSLATEFD